jgi:hypothetical protein
MGTELKGQGMVSAIAACRELAGNDATERILARTHRVGALVATGELDPAQWYPIEVWDDWMTALVDVMGAPMVATLSRRAAELDVNSVFRFVLALFSPATLVKLLPRFIKSYCRGADFEQLAINECDLKARLFNFSLGKALIYEDFLVGIATFLELSGGKHVHIETIDGGRDGDPFVTFVLRWEDPRY